MRITLAALLLAFPVFVLPTAAASNPSPAPQAWVGPTPKAWEGEGVSVPHTLTRPPRPAAATLSRGAGEGFAAGIASAHNPSPGDFGGLALDPQPGARLPLDVELADEQGHRVSLGRFFTGKTVLLAFEYLRCKTICGLALGRLAQAAAGLDIPVLAISIDPRDSPADAAAALSRYTGPGAQAGWHFLTGPEAAVRPIADSAGFRYRYDIATDQYIHSVGYVVAAADGTISSYLPELDITSAQLRSAIATAVSGQSSGPVERLLLLCFGGAASGRFTPLVETALVLLNLAGVLAAIGLFAWVQRRRHG